MDTSTNRYDSIEELIFKENVRIKAIDLHTDMNMLVIVLTSGAVLQQRLSDYPRLSSATSAQLENFELIAGSTGVHWPDLDEDISLKGILRDTLRSQVAHNKVA